jgi:hypothetical protein
MNSKFGDSALGGNLVGCALDYLTAIRMAFAIQFPDCREKLTLEEVGKRLSMHKIYKRGIHIISMGDGELDDFGAYTGLREGSNEGTFQTIQQISTGGSNRTAYLNVNMGRHFAKFGAAFLYLDISTNMNALMDSALSLN